MQDSELLHRYVETGSEAAFTELVNRHVHLVFSAALRQVPDRQLAEEVTQRTFCLLAKKAPTLRRKGPALVGWLYRTARFVALEALRSEQRRRQREEEAMRMNPSPDEVDAAWQHLAPVLDQAMHDLSESDRLAILVRFFQDQPMQAVGDALGVSEAAAKMRVSRAVARLRRILARNGVALPVTVMASVLAQKTVQAAPAPLAPGAISAAAHAVEHCARPWLQPLLIELMAMIHCKTALLVGALLAVSAAVISSNHARSAAGLTAGSNVRPMMPRDLPARPAETVQATHSQTTDNLQLESARKHLRAILSTPWGRRRYPQELVREALLRFRDQRAAALPVLMEFVRAGEMQARYAAFTALQDLGTEAAPALPELLVLLKADKLAIFNDQIPKTIAAIHPGPDLIPEIVEAIQSPAATSFGRLSDTILLVAQRNPGSEETYRPVIAGLLAHENVDVRLCAARTLAHLPGPKDPAVLTELVNGLNPAALGDPHYYDPVVDEEHATVTLKQSDAFIDSYRQSTAIDGLKSFGTAATEAIPWLKKLAEVTANSELRQAALVAIGTVAPDQRTATPEIDRLMREREISAALAEKAASGHAAFSDLLEGLNYSGSVAQCAEALGNLGPEAQTALPALKTAFETFGDYYAGETLKRLAPETLAECLQQPASASAAAAALGELGARAAFALPALYERIESGPVEDRHAMAEAIRQIDPDAPKPLYVYSDLSPAVSALMQASEAAERGLRKRVLDLYVQRLQDLNQVTRGELSASAKALLQVDHGLYDIFQSKLCATDPSIRELLPLSQ